MITCVKETLSLTKPLYVGLINKSFNNSGRVSEICYLLIHPEMIKRLFKYCIPYLCLLKRILINTWHTVCFIFQVATSEVLPASMFIPVPGPEKESQNTPQTLSNSTSEDTKKQTGGFSS